MAKYIRHEKGVVLEVIDLPDEMIPGQNIFPPAFAKALAKVKSDDVAAGWLWDGKTLAPPPEVDEVTEAPKVTSVSSAQGKIQLARTPHKLGEEGETTMLAAVTEMLPNADIETQIWFSDARTWEFSSPNVRKIGKALGLKVAEIQELFNEAAKISEI